MHRLRALTAHSFPNPERSDEQSSTTLLPQAEQQPTACLMALADEPSLNSINRQALAAGGGRKRAALTLDPVIGLGLSQADGVCLASAVETYQASLVHDDLQDQDAQRRGQQAVGQNTAARSPSAW